MWKQISERCLRMTTELLASIFHVCFLSSVICGEWLGPLMTNHVFPGHGQHTITTPTIEMIHLQIKSAADAHVTWTTGWTSVQQWKWTTSDNRPVDRWLSTRERGCKYVIRDDANSAVSSSCSSSSSSSSSTAQRVINRRETVSRRSGHRTVDRQYVSAGSDRYASLKI